MGKGDVSKKDKGPKRSLNDLNDSMIQFNTPKRATKRDSVEGQNAARGDTEMAVTDAHVDVHDTGDVQKVGGSNIGLKQSDMQQLAELVAAKVKNEMFVTIDDAVTSAVNKALENLKDHVESVVERAIADKLETLKAAIRVGQYRSDQLEQYTRRETVKICGLEEQADETTGMLEKAVIEIANVIDVPLNPCDISVVHRSGPKKNGKPRPVLCKFVSRKKKEAIISNRRALKNADSAGNKVFIYDDLTPLRSKLLHVVKKKETVHHAYTSNGKIFACLKDTDDPNKHLDLKKVVVENPDDLFKIGFEDIPYNELGINTPLI